MSAEEAQQRAIKGIGKGLLKTISKMGISTIPSYCGAQIFEAVGLEPALVERHFTGTPSRIGGHRRSRCSRARRSTGTPAPTRTERRAAAARRRATRGARDGEHHMWNPETIALLQHAVRHGGAKTYEEYSRLVNEDAARKATLRGLLRFRFAEDGGIPLDEVEPAAEIVKRFSTGAMSLGSLGARGARDARDRDEPARRQVEHRRGRRGPGALHPATRTATRAARRSSRSRRAASASTSTTSSTPTSSRSRWRRARSPARAASCPGHKVDAYIAKIRYSTPGVGLISPPPHHDIYSIEDLKQLIYDLRCANPDAQVSVKLVSEVGVGTVAAGVAKAQRRPRRDLRPRRRHRRLAALVDPVGRRAVGDRARRDAADARAERPALADLGADRRPAQDRPRRRDRRRCSAPTRWASRPRR